MPHSGRGQTPISADERLPPELRPSAQVHAALHCVANTQPNPGNYRVLFEPKRTSPDSAEEIFRTRTGREELHLPSTMFSGLTGTCWTEHWIAKGPSSMQIGDRVQSLECGSSGAEATGTAWAYRGSAQRTPDTCPIRAAERWLTHVRTVLPGGDRGPLFLRLDAGGRIRLGRLSDRGVARVVQRSADRAGLDPTRFAGHSLPTQVADGGVSERSIINQTGYRSLTIARRYIRDGELFRDDNAARGVGL